MNANRRTSLRRRRPLGVILSVAGVVGGYFLLKLILPDVAGLLDGFFAYLVEKLVRFKED